MHVYSALARSRGYIRMRVVVIRDEPNEFDIPPRASWMRVRQLPFPSSILRFVERLLLLSNPLTPNAVSFFFFFFRFLYRLVASIKFVPGRRDALTRVPARSVILIFYSTFFFAAKGRTEQADEVAKISVVLANSTVLPSVPQPRISSLRIF